MGVDLKTITQLRDMTGAGIADCKSALDEANGDIDQAVEVLRKKGGLKAAKKSDRATNEGVVAMAKSDNKVAVVTLACETDFVAKNENFIAATSEYAEKLLAVGADEFKTWAIENIKAELVIKVGENIQLGDFGIVEGEIIGTYLHSNKKTGSVVTLTGPSAQAGGSQEVANDIAMQVVAMSPRYLKPVDVPQDVIDKEKEIYGDQMKDENKPADIIEKIIEGKLGKFYNEICLINQQFIKDDSKKISDLLEDGVELKEFKKFSV
jgi:elongation factor Ts